MPSKKTGQTRNVTSKSSWAILAVLVIILIAGLAVIIYFAVQGNTGSSSGSGSALPSSSPHPDNTCVAIEEGFCSASATNIDLKCAPHKIATQFHSENVTNFIKTQELVDAIAAEGFPPIAPTVPIGDPLQAFFIPFNLVTDSSAIFRIAKVWADSSYAQTGTNRENSPALFYAGYTSHAGAVFVRGAAINNTVIDFNDVGPSPNDKDDIFGDIKVMHEAKLTSSFTCP
jgi:hypothetical protein